MDRERRAKHYLIDMDGVIYRGRNMIPGADRFVAHLEKLGRKFLFLTNSSDSTPVNGSSKPSENLPIKEGEL